ncbi:MAG: hypothetical protein ACAF41_29825 [Leptolyngbya sp. BL-A-14]
MLTPTHSPLPVDHLDLTPKVLESRDQYRSCHICLPGEDYRVAAIVVDGRYYSLVKVVQDRLRSLEVAKRLTSAGKAAVITKLAKGYAIWRLEPEAYVDSCPRSPSQVPASVTDLPVCKILESRNEYKACHISLEDSEQRLAAILVDGNYYGLLKVVTTQQQALTLATRLQRKEVGAVITKAAQSYAVWFLEPNAIVCKD